MKSSDILLSLDNEELKVLKNCYGDICVRYIGAFVKNGYFIESAVGIGKDFESACEDYLNKIRGKTLVFNPNNDTRKEVSILG